MKRLLLSALSALILAQSGVAAEVPEPAVADFTGAALPLKRLNGMCNTVAMTGNLYPSRTNRVETLLKALEIPETRFHDVVLENPGIQLVDVSRIFPLFHADENDPKNYDFRPTDLYLARARELGGELEFRFGEQIEHQGEQFQVQPPADIAKWARICLNIARHYNEGWGDGYRWNIRRFSVWEEPDNDQLFYRSTKGNYEQCYFKMYAAVARLLKDRFPGVQVGGPNTMGYCHKFRSFVDYCEKEKLPLDFAAFTTYPRTPEGMFGPVRAARKYLDEHGFGKTELELSEWHYGPSDWSLSFKDLVRWEKELTGPEAVAFTAAALIAGQDEPIDRMFYYAMYVSDWGVFKRGGWPRPMYYAFRDFAEAAHEAGRVPCPLNPAKGWYTLATRRTDGSAHLLVSAFGTQEADLRLTLKGVKGLAATVVDMEGEPKSFTDFTFADGVLVVKRPAANAVILFTAAKPSCDVAAYVWPAYQPDPRWAELGVFKAGKGEWQNVWEAVPKWEGHRQPLVPLWGYEDESDPKVVAKKIDAAADHGVNVFIYDWYWYGGRPFLEEGLDRGFLKAPNRNRMKFFVMWANHHVNWLWDNTTADKRWGAPRKDWLGFVTDEEFRTALVPRWIERYFREPNYYRIDGKPVFMIYEVGTFVTGVGGVEKAAAALDFLRAECVKAGLGGVHLMACDYGLRREWVRALKIDSASIYNFVHWSNPAGNPDYADWAKKGAARFETAKAELGVPTYFAHASVGWDTNPRYPAGSVQPSAVGSTPEKFEAVLRRAKDWTEKNLPEGRRLVTVNSWNEWTEGSYLEPDTVHGFGYLEAIRRIFD